MCFKQNTTTVLSIKSCQVGTKPFVWLDRHVPSREPLWVPATNNFTWSDASFNPDSTTIVHADQCDQMAKLLFYRFGH